MMSLLQTVLVLSLIQFCLGATVPDSSILEDPSHCQLLLSLYPELPWLRSLSDACTAHYQCSLHNTNAAGHCNQQFLKDMSDRCKDGFSDAFYDECQKSAEDMYHEIVVGEEVNILHSRSLKNTSRPGNIVDFDETRYFDDDCIERLNLTVLFKNDGTEAQFFKVVFTQNGKHLFEEEGILVAAGNDHVVQHNTTEICEIGANVAKLQVPDEDGTEDWDTVDDQQRDVPRPVSKPSRCD